MTSKKQNRKYAIGKFDASSSKPHRVWVIIGPRGTGKSVLLSDLLYHTRQHYDFALAMTATSSTVNTLEQIMPRGCIYRNGYDYEIAEKFVKLTDKFSGRQKKKRSVLILDDCMYDQKVMKSKAQAKLHLNGRHYHDALFNTTQYCMILPSMIRSNVDYVLALRDNILANRKRLYQYFFGLFPSFSEFNKVYTQVTQNYGALVLDRTQSSSDIDNCISWYRATPQLPPFSIGSRKFFALEIKLRRQIQNQKPDKQKRQTISIN